MSRANQYELPGELILGQRFNDHVPRRDQHRQRSEAAAILWRFQHQPGVILADEVGMGKTFVALSVAYTVARQSKRGPVVIMAPAHLLDKWAQDLGTFCELYLDGVSPVAREANQGELRAAGALRYGVARRGLDFLKLLDDPAYVRCHLIFLTHGAMSRYQSDKWMRLALIREALRRHARGGAARLIQVRKVIHRFMAQLLRAKREERASVLGKELWQDLLAVHPSQWKPIFDESVSDEGWQLPDDPIPEAAVKLLDQGKLDLKPLAETLREMPLRASVHVRSRIQEVRAELREAEKEIWKKLLANSSWRSPLLVLDEAHHLKNPTTGLPRQLQSPETVEDLRTGDGAMSRVFDRMLFLSATPFQLGHSELVRVLQRFGDVRWGPMERKVKTAQFNDEMKGLERALTDSQRAAIQLQKTWATLPAEDLPEEDQVDAWWEGLRKSPSSELTVRQRALLDAFEHVREKRLAAETKLQPWLIRHNKGEHWPDEPIRRRERVEGRRIITSRGSGGIEVPPEQMLPFFLAARSAANPDQDVLGEALCSSYEAFRHTREHRATQRDDMPAENVPDLTHTSWYLSEFDRALEQHSGNVHPKVAATVRRVVDLWEQGEKVLVFAFYRKTCRALRVHISKEIERRMGVLAGDRLGEQLEEPALNSRIEEIRSRFIDADGRRRDSPATSALRAILECRTSDLAAAGFSGEERADVLAVMRRFLRVPTTLIRSFPLNGWQSMHPEEVIRQTLEQRDGSGVSWRDKFEAFIDFLVKRCSEQQRRAYLEAAKVTQTGAIHVQTDHDGEDVAEDATGSQTTRTLANVQLATGQTDRDRRMRLMHAFNTPFFPDVLVCSTVMGEGVDLHRYCRHIIHHDLAWNPSQIEQRTGRIDRIGCKAENRHSIQVMLPYVSGASDERQFRVMNDREQWFRIVMGQDKVAELIPPEADRTHSNLPTAFGEELSFNLGLKPETGAIDKLAIADVSRESSSNPVPH